MAKRKIPFVQCSKMTECGLCCSAMILRYYNSYETIHELRSYLDIGRDGTSMKQLKELFTRLNFSTQIYKAGINRLKEFKEPVILFWDSMHFVVLEKINSKYAVIVDPIYGRITVKIEDFEESYSGFVLKTMPNEKFTPKKKEVHIGEIFKDAFKKNKVLLFRIFIASLMIYFFNLGMPILIQNIIDSISSGIDNYSYKGYFIFMIGFCFLYTLVQYLKDKKLITLNMILDKYLIGLLFEKILKVPYKFFDVRNKADIIYTLNSTGVVRDVIASQIISGLINCGAILFIFYYMFTKSKLLTYTAFILFILDVVITMITKPKVLELNKYLVSEENKVQAVQLETLNSIFQVKMLGIEEEMRKQWKNTFQKYQNKYKYKEILRVKLQAMNFFVEELSPLLILNIGIYLMLEGKVTLGVVIAFYSLSKNFFIFSSSIFSNWYQIMNCSIYFERIDEIANVQDEKNGDSKLDIEGNISVENIEFSYYRNSRKVINDISFEIKKGEKVAIVGKSGCGKSTLGKILVGLYEPTKGNIYYDNVNNKKIDKRYFRDQIGVVPQEVSLFNKTIYENIVMDRTDIGYEEIEQACRAAQIFEEIAAMPMKFYTYVSENGNNLSGGQRQRIALARAIVKKPKIVLLDEATSSLDNINENKVSKYLQKMGCTVIIIAHRLTTIKDSDLILVMDNGKVVEKGMHEELMKNKEYYYNLYDTKIFT